MNDFDDTNLKDIAEPTNEDLFSLDIALLYEDFDEETNFNNDNYLLN